MNRSQYNHIYGLAPMTLLPVLQKVDEDRKEQFQAYFKNAENV